MKLNNVSYRNKLSIKSKHEKKESFHFVNQVKWNPGHCIRFT